MTGLSSGTEVTKLSTIGGLNTFGLSRTLSVNFRQCGSDLHAYLVPSSISNSAYCVRKYGHLSKVFSEHFRIKLNKCNHFSLGLLAID